MKRLLPLAIVMMLAGHAYAASWMLIAAQVRQSIVEIALAEGSCTGVVIDDERDFVLTAAHCDSTDSGKNLFVDHQPAKVRSKDEKADLMVLFVEGIDRPALKLAKDDPKVGDEVASYGYGWALEAPLFRVAHVSADDLALEGFEKVRRLAIDASFVGGQSGGPVVNAMGELVMLVQLGNTQAGFGVGCETIKDKVGRFFQK